MEKILKTKKRIEREKRNELINKEIRELVSNPENSKMAVYDMILEKYNIKTYATLYRIMRGA